MDMQPKLSTAESLRLLADWYEKNPDLPPPIISIYFYGKEHTPTSVAARLGEFQEGGDETFYELKKTFGALELRASFYRPHHCVKRTVMKPVEEWASPLAKEAA